MFSLLSNISAVAHFRAWFTHDFTYKTTSCFLKLLSTIFNGFLTVYYCKLTMYAPEFKHPQISKISKDQNLTV